MVSYVGVKPHLQKKLQKLGVIAKLEIFGVQTIPILCTWGLNSLSFCSFPTLDCSNVAFFKQHMNSIIHELFNVFSFCSHQSSPSFVTTKLYNYQILQRMLKEEKQ
jgi:hypothetical protein